jgi:hypothetical protein
MHPAAFLCRELAVWEARSWAGIIEASNEAQRPEGGNALMTEPTKEELMARIAELEKQAGSRKRGNLEFRVGEKGGVSVYGLGRFPVTLYYEQWVRLLDAANELRTFLEENKSRLKLKTKE